MTTNEVHAIVHSHSQHLHGANKMCVGFRVDSFTSTNQIKVINFYLSTVMDFIICHNLFFSLDIYFVFANHKHLQIAEQKINKLFSKYILSFSCLQISYKSCTKYSILHFLQCNIEILNRYRDLHTK